MNNIDYFEKRFSVGVTLGMTLAENKAIIDEFKDNIYDMYFSPPMGAKYHTRKQVTSELELEGSEEYLWEFLNYIKQNDIKLELALNTFRLNEKDIINAIDYTLNHIHIDSIVTQDKYADLIRSKYPNVPLTYSYNNNIRTLQELEDIRSLLYTDVVLGSSSIRDFEMFRYLKNKGFRTRYLINNGCSFNCLWCSCSQFCLNIFEMNLRKYSVDELYALQSIFPWELHSHTKNEWSIDIIKISSRTSTYDILRRCLYSYINNINKEYILENVRYYYLWGRLGHFSKYHHIFNYEKIDSIKKRIWQSETKRLDLCYPLMTANFKDYTNAVQALSK